MLNIVLFGPPGAGKGTQAEKLIGKYNLVHLSTGDIFRANIKGETELGNLAKGYLDAGNLVPDEVTIKMLESEVDKNPEAEGIRMVVLLGMSCTQVVELYPPLRLTFVFIVTEPVKV